MAELGSGNGTSYPAALDVDNSVEADSSTTARADVPNDLAAAVIAVQTELGTDPAGTQTNVKTFLQTEQATNGTYSRKIIALQADSGCSGVGFSVVAGKVYNVECYVYPVSGACRIQNQSGYVGVLEYSTSTGGWEKLSGTAVSSTTGSESFKIVADGGASTFYVDDVSVKQVNGNAGVMTNMTAADFVGDTP